MPEEEKGSGEEEESGSEEEVRLLLCNTCSNLGTSCKGSVGVGSVLPSYVTQVAVLRCDAYKKTVPPKEEPVVCEQCGKNIPVDKAYFAHPTDEEAQLCSERCFQLSMGGEAENRMLIADIQVVLLRLGAVLDLQPGLGIRFPAMQKVLAEYAELLHPENGNSTEPAEG